MSVYKGVAYATATGAGSNRHFAVSHATIESTPATRGDHTSFEQDASTTMVLHYNQSTDGVTPPAAANSLIIELRHANTSSVLDSVTITDPPTSGSVTLNPTIDGTINGTPVVGDFRIYVRAIRTGVGTYDVNSDTLNLQGVVRINPTSLAITVGHNGAANPAAYTDDIEVLVNPSHGPGLELNHRHFDVEVRTQGAETLLATARTTGTDPQLAEVMVDNRFPATQVSVNVDVIVIAVPSAIAPDSEPGLTWIQVPMTTPDRVNGKKVRKGPVPVDASIRIDTHLQVNDNVYDPALDTTRRLTADLGFVTAVVTNARGVLLSGITYTQTLHDAADLVAPAISNSRVTTATGRPALMDAWDSQLPGGTWVHDVAITAPANAVGLEFQTSEARTLISANPSIALICGSGPATGDTDSRHLEPGMAVLVGLTTVNVSTGVQVALDPGTAEAAVARFNVTLGRAEFLDVDGLWKPISGQTVYFWPLAPSPGDANTHIWTYADTASWGVSDLFVIGKAEVGGVPVTNFMKEPVVSGVNNHTEYQFDGAGFVGFPTR